MYDRLTDPQRGIDGGHHLAAGLARVCPVEGRRVAVGDAGGRAGGQRHPIYSISPGRTATELRRKLAPEEDPASIMQPARWPTSSRSSCVTPK
jgi:hypothetical protein